MYPLEAFTSTIVGAEEDEGRLISATISEVPGTPDRISDRPSNADDPELGSWAGVRDDEGPLTLRAREVVDSDLKEAVSPLKDDLRDMVDR